MKAANATPAFSAQDHFFMAVALREAEKNLGLTGENPSVGCVIAQNGVILGKGATGRGGSPHAEVAALECARLSGKKISGATAYVTLEPCSHYGKNPPCAEAFISAGIAEVKIAVTDPNPIVSGGGVKRLKSAGVKVETGLCAEAAEENLQGFLSLHRRRRPYITAKIGASIDGRITDARGKSQWITGEAARAAANFSRCRYDVIAVGINTILADNPRLDCRAPGFTEFSPHIAVFDRKLRTPADAQIFALPERRVIIYHQQKEIPPDLTVIKNCPVEFVKTPDGDNFTAIAQAATKDWSERKFQNILIEGGGALIASFMQAELCDRFTVYRAGKILGAKGAASVGSFPSHISLDECFTPVRYEQFSNGDDVTVYKKT